MLASAQEVGAAGAGAGALDVAGGVAVTAGTAEVLVGTTRVGAGALVETGAAKHAVALVSRWAHQDARCRGPESVQQIHSTKQIRSIPASHYCVAPPACLPLKRSTCCGSCGGQRYRSGCGSSVRRWAGHWCTGRNWDGCGRCLCQHRQRHLGASHILQAVWHL